jgi:hypothetical protein
MKTVNRLTASSGAVVRRTFATAKHVLASACFAIEPLWVLGLALLQIVWVAIALPLSGEAFKWTEYKLLGTLFPCLLAGLSLAGTRLKRHAWGFMSIKVGLATACILFVAFFLQNETYTRVATVWMIFAAALAMLWAISPACRPGRGGGRAPLASERHS